MYTAICATPTTKLTPHFHPQQRRSDSFPTSPPSSCLSRSVDSDVGRTRALVAFGRNDLVVVVAHRHAVLGPSCKYQSQYRFNMYSAASERSIEKRRDLPLKWLAVLTVPPTRFCVRMLQYWVKVLVPSIEGALTRVPV